MPALEPVPGTALGRFLRMFQGRPHLLNRVAWMIGARVLGMAVGVVGSVWVARCLGPRNFGISGMVQSLATFGVVFINVVYPLLLVRDYKNAPDDEARNQLIQVTNGFRLVASLIICVLAALLLAFHLEPQEFHLAGWFFLPILLLNALQPSWIFQAAEKQQFQAVLAVLQPMLLAFYYLIWIKPGMSAGPDLLGVTLVSAILTVVYWKAIFKLTAFRGRFFIFDRWDEAWRLIHKSRWLFISALAIYVYNWLDQPLLGWLHSLEEQGRYRTAVRVTDAVQGFLTILPTILFPRFIEWRKKGEEFFWDRQKRILFFGVIVGGVVVLAGFILIPLLYPFIYPARSSSRLKLWMPWAKFTRLV
jgi:O-antigen/teichoic acid export membrane protein